MYGPNAQKAFGAVQMIFVGDLYQLPPVVGNEEREVFRTHYATLYFLQRQRVGIRCWNWRLCTAKKMRSL